MPLMIDAKIKPSGSFPAVDAADVLMPSGKRLTEEEFGTDYDPTVVLDILPEQTVEFSAVSDKLFVWSQTGDFPELVAGETYKVLFGGFGEYTCVAFACVFNGVDAVALGCGAIIGLEVNPDAPQEPFLFGVFVGGSECGFFTPVSGESRTVRVYQVLYPAHLPTIADVHDGKIPQVVNGRLVYTDPSNMKVGEKTLETYIGDSVNSYIEEALGGDY